MNIPQRLLNVLVGLGSILFVFLVFLSIRTIKEVKYVGTADTSTTINVEGTSEVVAVPDIATFSFTVSETAKTVADAQTAATNKVNAALKIIRDGGVADKDISTQSYNINPHYEYSNAVCPRAAAGVDSIVYCPSGKSTLTGYDVSQTIEVKVRDLTKAGALLTSIGGQVSNVNSLQFSVDEPTKVQAQAREKAITAAKEKAEVLSKQLGVRLVRIVNFSEYSAGGYPRAVYNSYSKAGDAMMAAAPMAPEIPTGEQKYTSNVSITYEIQ